MALTTPPFTFDTKNRMALPILAILLTGLAVPLDWVTIAFVQQAMTDQAYGFWKVISDYGDGRLYFIIALSGLVIGYWGQLASPFLARRLFEFSAMSLASLISAGVVVRLIKWAIGRPRPKLWLEEAGHELVPFSMMSELNAFPSGHTQTAFTVAFLCGLAWPRYRLVFLCMAGLVGISRIALLNHWPSDVVMGAFIGVLVPFYAIKRCHAFFKGSGISFLRPRKRVYYY